MRASIFQGFSNVAGVRRIHFCTVHHDVWSSVISLIPLLVLLLLLLLLLLIFNAVVHIAEHSEHGGPPDAQC